MREVKKFEDKAGEELRVRISQKELLNVAFFIYSYGRVSDTVGLISSTRTHP
jgi:hypothetical protein